MKHPFRNDKTRLLFTAGALFIATSASAQTSNETSQLLNQLNQLQTQVQTLSRAVYRGEAPPPSMAAPAAMGGDVATSAANYEVRMSAIEDQQRKLTGDIEKLTYDVQQMKDRLDRMQADNDQRFQQAAHASTPPENTTLAPPPQTGGSSGSTLGTLNATGNGASEALYEDAFANVRDGKYDQAEAKFKQFLSQYPGHPLSANAQYWLGETYYVRGDYKAAAKTFAQGYQDYPKSGKAADSLLKLGLSLSKLDRKDDACLSLRQLQKDFPGETGQLQKKALQEIKQLGCP